MLAGVFGVVALALLVVVVILWVKLRRATGEPIIPAVVIACVAALPDCRRSRASLRRRNSIELSELCPVITLSLNIVLYNISLSLSLSYFSVTLNSTF